MLTETTSIPMIATDNASGTSGVNGVDGEPANSQPLAVLRKINS